MANNSSAMTLGVVSKWSLPMSDEACQSCLGLVSSSSHQSSTVRLLRISLHRRGASL